MESLDVSISGWSRISVEKGAVTVRLVGEYREAAEAT